MEMKGFLNWISVPQLGQPSHVSFWYDYLQPARCAIEAVPVTYTIGTNSGAGQRVRELVARNRT